jgi:hypothetical protein
MSGSLVVSAVQEPVLSVFLKAMAEKYNNDSRSTSLALSWIAEKAQWYASVNRFPSSGHQQICSSYGDTLDQAVRNVMRIWKIEAGLVPDENLKKFTETEL